MYDEWEDAKEASITWEPREMRHFKPLSSVVQRTPNKPKEQNQESEKQTKENLQLHKIVVWREQFDRVVRVDRARRRPSLLVFPWWLSRLGDWRGRRKGRWCRLFLKQKKHKHKLKLRTSKRETKSLRRGGLRQFLLGRVGRWAGDFSPSDYVSNPDVLKPSQPDSASNNIQRLPVTHWWRRVRPQPRQLWERPFPTIGLCNQTYPPTFNLGSCPLSIVDILPQSLAPSCSLILSWPSNKGSSLNFTRRPQTKELLYGGGGEGVWTRFVVRSTAQKKKKKKKKNAFALRCLQRQISKKQKCSESFSDLQGSRCTHADMVDQSQMSILFLKARLNFKALVGARTRSSSTPSRSTPATCFWACRKRKKKNK